MRIGLYDPYLDTMSGGEKYMLQAAKCLANAHDVVIFWDKTDEDEIKSEAVRKFALDLSGMQFAENIFDSKHSLFSRLRESKKYDAIIVLSDGSIPLIGCPLLLHFQSPVEWVRGDSLKTRIKLHNVGAVLCNSYFTKSYIDKKFGVHSSVLYPPVHIDPPQKRIEKENIILNVGRYGIKAAGSSYKKQEMMIEMFKQLKNAGVKGWKLHLVLSIAEHDMETLEALKKQAKDYPITFIVNADRKHLVEEYMKARIYWHAAGFNEDLHVHPDRAEHFGISTVEAMAMGAVPIVIKAGGQPEIVVDGESGLLWSTEKELIHKTKEVIEDKKLWSKLSENAKERALVFDTHHFCEKLLSLIP